MTKTAAKKSRPFTLNGIEVIDPPREYATVDLEIIDKDIKSAKRSAPDECVIAQGFLRQFPECKKVLVHRYVTYLQMDIRNKPKWLRYRTPEAAKTETVAFDRGGSFQPDTYTFRPPPPRRQPTGRRQGSAAAGARDAGSKDRTPSFKRIAHHYDNVRIRASTSRT